MTARELIKRLDELQEDEKDLQVKFYNEKYEDYDTVNKIGFSMYGGKFVLLNEA